MNKKISLIVILIMICTIIFPYVTSATEIAVTNEIVNNILYIFLENVRKFETSILSSLPNPINESPSLITSSTPASVVEVVTLGSL